MTGKHWKNNITITLSVLCAKNEKIYPAYLLKQSSKCEKQVIILIILNGEGWHYLAVKLSALLREIMSKHDGDLYCLNCFH